jgi:hypothetical protein
MCTDDVTEKWVTIPILKRVREIINEINKLIDGFARDSIPRMEVRLPSVESENASFEFYLQVSWMYVALFEEGRQIVDFLIERARFGGLDQDARMSKFRKIVHALRTDLQHGLDCSKREDCEKLLTGRGWMSKVCGKPDIPDEYFFPNSLDEWNALRDGFEDEALEFVQLLREVLLLIERDEFRNDILDEWEIRESSTLKAHEFDKIIFECVQELGIPSLDLKRFGVVHYDRWRKALVMIDGSVDVREIAKRLVSQSLLEHWGEFCPITGQDVMSRFGLSPGREIGKLVALAGIIWREAPCDAETLLVRLAEQVDGFGPG